MEYSIREIARMFGNSVGAVRFYEEAGLVKPRRDEAGNRVYSQQNVMELFYLRKYCTFGLKIREVAEYFEEQNTKDLAEVSRLLEEKRLEAQRMARYYEKSARWIASYNERLARLEEDVGRFTHMEAPDYCVLMDEALVGKGREKQEVAQKWIGAAPMSRVSRLVSVEGDAVIQDRACFIVSDDDARELGLPMPDYARRIAGAPCLYTVERIDAGGFEGVNQRRMLEIRKGAEALGHRPANLVISNLLFTHIVADRQYKYFEIFIPVDVDYPIVQDIR